jgi:hypothetical protein
MGHAEQPTLNIVLVRSRRREVLPVAEALCRFNPIYGQGACRPPLSGPGCSRKRCSGRLIA